ncbi:MAG TPA: hypothetical protein PKM43_00730 [Verrucomicrobiota bacterium]|nr:hypothetical protein [Verrucomicrobiota bacterium]HRZ35527.1 hypothetical protein [Candidatus Paceibacterota bacterium]HRZ53944.1 hypothetical protein [Candidatus Paceibacterota bacterium]
MTAPTKPEQESLLTLALMAAFADGGKSESERAAFQLKELFSSLTDQARSLHERYAGEIRQRASTLNPGQLLGLVRGNPGGELPI